jgi:hypothetical protein
MSVYNRLNLNFDTNRFGDAQVLSDNAANSVALVNSNIPQLSNWQVSDLASGSISMSNYLQNPTTSNNQAMLVSAASIALNALACANTNASFYDVFNTSQNLIIVLNQFQSHTDNICGITPVKDQNYPSYDSATGAGQMNMMNLSKAQEPQTNTSSILGSFTSLFIPDILQANTNLLYFYQNELTNSITVTSNPDGSGTDVYTSNLAASEIANINSYMYSTANTLSARYTSDWSFFRSSIQVMKDIGSVNKFSNMGGTNTYLVNNVIGTPSLISKLQSG